MQFVTVQSFFSPRFVTDIGKMPGYAQANEISTRHERK